MRIVNGVTLRPIYGWAYGLYLITTDSVYAAETGTGYFTVAKGSADSADPGKITYVYVDTAHSLADAVTVIKIHEGGTS